METEISEMKRDNSELLEIINQKNKEVVDLSHNFQVVKVDEKKKDYEIEHLKKTNSDLKHIIHKNSTTVDENSFKLSNSQDVGNSHFTKDNLVEELKNLNAQFNVALTHKDNF